MEEDFEDYLLEASAALQDTLAEALAEYHSKGGVPKSILQKGKSGVDKFGVILSPYATKDMDGFSDSVCGKIARVLEALAGNPFQRGNLIKKIKGKNADFFRLRADRYRVFYVIEAGKVVVQRVLGKKDAERYIRKVD
ncbi:MAG: type II toxin-antitoxin system RelE/ParE family toxin [Nitrospirae bacterium]|nr:type II toxin-antitoxin system RelE/ParE family toxin [Nitrospirota bacterium]